VAKIADLVEARTLEGVSDVRDESDRTGLRVVVEVRKGCSPQVVLAQLYKHTRLQSRFSCNVVALVGGVPAALSLRDMLRHWLDFRVAVVQRRAASRLRGAQERLHLVQGLLAAMGAMDGVVAAIRGATDGAAARAALVAGFGLSEAQADGVLALPLRRLTGLEAGKLGSEAEALAAESSGLAALLGSRELVLADIVREAEELAAKHGSPRRSALLTESGAIDDSALVADTEDLILYSRRGFIKRVHAEAFRVQARGGTGKAATRLRENDALAAVVPARSHDDVLVLTAAGRAYGVKAHRVPEASRTAAGTALAALVDVGDADGGVAAILAVPGFAPGRSLVLLTRQGAIKKTPLPAFATINRSGLGAIGVAEGDRLCWAGVCDDRCSVLIASSGGRVLHHSLDEATVRSMGRTARGVRSMKLKEGQELVAMAVLPAELSATIAAAASCDETDESEEGGATSDDSADEGAAAAEGEPSAATAPPTTYPPAAAPGPWLLLVTARGVGKRVPVRLFRKSGRAGQGVLGLRLAEGDRLVCAELVSADSDEQLAKDGETRARRCGFMSRYAVRTVVGAMPATLATSS